MGVLVFSSRIHSVLDRINRVEYRLTELNKKLSDLQQYSANISDGSISMNDMMNAPGSMFGRQMMFMQYAHNASLTGANQQFGMMQPQMQMQMQQMPDPNAQTMYRNWIFQNLYKQQKEIVAKQETKLLNEQEKAIQQEKTKLEAESKMLSNEYDSLKQARDKDIDRFWKFEYA